MGFRRPLGWSVHSLPPRVRQRVSFPVVPTPSSASTLFSLFLLVFDALFTLGQGCFFFVRAAEIILSSLTDPSWLPPSPDTRPSMGPDVFRINAQEAVRMGFFIFSADVGSGFFSEVEEVLGGPIAGSLLFSYHPNHTMQSLGLLSDSNRFTFLYLPSILRRTAACSYSPGKPQKFTCRGCVSGLVGKRYLLRSSPVFLSPLPRVPAFQRFFPTPVSRIFQGCVMPLFFADGVVEGHFFFGQSAAAPLPGVTGLGLCGPLRLAARGGKSASIPAPRPSLKVRILREILMGSLFLFFFRSNVTFKSVCTGTEFYCKPRLFPGTMRGLIAKLSSKCALACPCCCSGIFNRDGLSFSGGAEWFSSFGVREPGP